MWKLNVVDGDGGGELSEKIYESERTLKKCCKLIKFYLLILAHLLESVISVLYEPIDNVLSVMTNGDN